MDKLSKNMTSSLKWAIGELSNEKEKLESKLNIARKRDETSALIEEVNAQKDALDRRISSLQDGLKVSADLVDDQVDELEVTISTVDEKLEIAQDRLANLEQEQYLEELGRKLNRSHVGELIKDESSNVEIFSQEKSHDLLDSSVPSSCKSTNKEIPSTTQTMTTPTSRIEIEEETTPSRISSEEPHTIQQTRSEKNTLQVPVEGLEETAVKLGIEPEFLVEKGTKALLRMIARNGGKLKFPLEIDQID